MGPLSATGQPPLAGGARLVCQAVVLENGLFLGRWQLAVGADRGGILYLLLVVGDLEVPGAHGGVVKRHEYEPVPGRNADPNGAERRQVGPGVEVDCLQLPDLAILGVNHVLATPFPDVGRFEHAGPSSRRAAFLPTVLPLETSRRQGSLELTALLDAQLS